MGEKQTVRISLLGTFSVSRGSLCVGEPMAGRESQSWKLLKYMCANYSRTVDVEELTRELIFAGSENNIDNTLRVRLRRARAILDRVGLGDKRNGLLLYGNGKYWINGDLEPVIDAREADGLYRRAADSTLGAEERLSACLRAIGLFGGRYLQYSEKSAYAELLREKYDAMFRALLRLVFELMRLSGDWSGVPRVCESVMRVFPDGLDVHDHVLCALIGAHMTAEAVTYYTNVAVALANTDLRLPDFGSYLERRRARINMGGQA